MSTSITFEELLVWNEEASTFWKSHLEANPMLLALPCGIGGAEDVQALVRHIWGVDLRWAHRLAGLPEIERDAMPSGPLDALFGLHQEAGKIYRGLLEDPKQDWDAPYTLNVAWLPPEARTVSRRKVMAHALFHGQRHWAQLATLERAAGYPSNFRGDILFSLGLT